MTILNAHQGDPCSFIVVSFRNLENLGYDSKKQEYSGIIEPLPESPCWMAPVYVSSIK